jgi:probable rRNA maturation factor
VDLDLAFSAAEDLSPQLLQAGGAWLDPRQAAEAWQELLALWLAQLAPELPPELRSTAYSAGLSLVDDTEIAALNQDWRDKEGPTDVLAFAAQDEGLEDAPPMPMPMPMPMPVPDGEPAEDAAGWPGEPLELGDIVISVETAARQAGEHGHGLIWELLFLASHGLLHLLGWDHPDDASLAVMLARQEALLAAVPVELSTFA